MRNFSSSIRRHLLLVTILAVAILLTLGTFGLVRTWETNRAHSAFRGIASDRTRAIAEAIRDAEVKIGYLRTFYKATGNTTDIPRFTTGFQSAAREAFQSDNELDAITLAVRINSADAAKLVADMRSSVDPNFGIIEQTDSTPARQATRYLYPVVFVEPTARNANLMGLDIASDSVLAGALARSTTTGPPQSSEIVVYSDDTGSYPAVWLIDAADNPGAPPTQEAFVAARLRVDHLVGNALAGLNPAGIDLFVYDTSPPGTAKLMYTYSSRTRYVTVPPTVANAQEEVPYSWSTELDIGGRKWKVLAHPAPAFIQAHTYSLSWVVLVVGLLSTAMLTTFWLTSLRRTSHVERMVQTRTAELSEEISRHRATEESLQKAHGELTTRVETINRRATEIELLNAMAELLQTCRGEAEAYQVVTTFAAKLFPAERGVLYSYDPTAQTLSGASRLLDRVSSWGECDDQPGEVAMDECWALRRGKLYLFQRDVNNLACGHVRASDRPRRYVCLPLSALGDTIGLLYLESRSSENFQIFDESKQRLISAVGEQSAMAIANLKLRETLRQQSIRDPLTGLFNRRFMEESLDRELHRARRGGFALSVVMMDIDHFKKFNDTYGHDAGDLVLRTVGGILLAETRRDDIPCRFGGEELVMILPGAALAAAAARAESLRKAVGATRVEHAGKPLPEVTISLGVATLSDQCASAEALFASADGALYRAKNGGRNRVETAAVENSAIPDGTAS